jgi:hypothetical protein
MRRLPILMFCCAAAALPLEARAQVGEAIGRIFDATNLRRAPETPPDFVVNTRPEPGALDYTPLSTPQPNDRTPKKTPAELEAIGNDLARAAASNKDKAARINIPDAASAPKSAPTSKADSTKPRRAVPRAN